MTARARVLVVDDDRLNRLMLTKLLEHEGYEVREAADGRQALDALAEEAFDLVLLDLVMPEVDGIEVLQTIKGSSKWWNTPVIMISAVEETESIVRCIELGADDYVLKPFDPVLLRARLNASLARRRFQDLEVEYHTIVKEQRAELDELNRRLAERVREAGP
jgi:adenylate cyclase